MTLPPKTPEYILSRFILENKMIQRRQEVRTTRSTDGAKNLSRDAIQICFAEQKLPRIRGLQNHSTPQSCDHRCGCPSGRHCTSAQTAEPKSHHGASPHSPANSAAMPPIPRQSSIEPDALSGRVISHQAPKTLTAASRSLRVGLQVRKRASLVSSLLVMRRRL